MFQWKWIILSPRISEADGVERSSRDRSKDRSVEGRNNGSSTPETAITASGHKEGYLQSHAQGLTSPDFRCRTQGPGPRKSKSKTRTTPAVSATRGRTGSGTARMLFGGQGVQVSCRHTKKELLTVPGSLQSAFTHE